jgi:hypothetical protein
MTSTKPKPSPVHETIAVADDPNVRTLRARVAELRRLHKAAVVARDRLQPNGTHAAAVTIERLQAQARVDELDDQLERVERELEAATRAAARRLVAARRPTRRELLEACLNALRALQAADDALNEHDMQTAVMAALMPPPHAMPFPVSAAIEALRRELAPPAEPVAAPPAPGKVRVRVVQTFVDRDRMKHWPPDGSGTEDLDERDAKDAIARGWAAPVE